MTTQNASFVSALEAVKSFGGTFLKHTIGADTAGLEIIKALKKLPSPTLEEWDALRLAFRDSAPKNTATATIDRQWQRLTKNAEMVKPKSTSADAIIKGQQREEEKAKLAQVSDAELETRIQKLADLDMKPTKLIAEQKRRQAVKDAPIKEAKAEAIKEIRKALDKADLATIEKVRKLLKL